MKKDCSFTFYHNAMRTLHNPCGTRKVFFAVLSPMLTTLCKLGLKVLKTFPYVLMSVVKDSCAKNYEWIYQSPSFFLRRSEISALSWRYVLTSPRAHPHRERFRIPAARKLEGESPKPRKRPWVCGWARAKTRRSRGWWGPTTPCVVVLRAARMRKNSLYGNACYAG